VELSSTLTGVSRALASDGAARASRVASLARAYQSGSYQPDGFVIARGLVSDALAGA
jgi:anti-sigma28 factor (negative regulator of flagellin synthesis)